MSDLTSIVALALVFTACALLVMGISFLWDDLQKTSAKYATQRLRKISPSTPSAATIPMGTLARRELESPIAQALIGLARQRKLEIRLRQAGSGLTPASFVLLSLLLGTVSALLGRLLLSEMPLLSVILGFSAGAYLPWLSVNRSLQKRGEQIVKQLPDAMDFFARSMRAGHPFASALKSAAEEVPQPLAAEFETTFDELNYGLDFEEAMQNMARRTGCEEVNFFVTAVLVQKSTGGNLAELMNRLAALMRERMRARGEVMIQAADMKGSARILMALPLGVAGILQFVNPDYIPVLLENSTGRMIVFIQVALMVTGYLIIKRMINFRI